MKNILVVSGHTDLNDSVANNLILETLQKELPDAEFDFLDKLYSDFKIDVKIGRASCRERVWLRV